MHKCTWMHYFCKNIITFYNVILIWINVISWVKCSTERVTVGKSVSWWVDVDIWADRKKQPIHRYMNIYPSLHHRKIYVTKVQSSVRCKIAQCLCLRTTHLETTVYLLNLAAHLNLSYKSNFHCSFILINFWFPLLFYC